MNEVRRKAITAVIEELDKLAGQMESTLSEIGTIKDAEEEVIENMPEGLKSSERGQQMQTALDYLEQAYDTAAELYNQFAELSDALNNASGE